MMMLLAACQWNAASFETPTAAPTATAVPTSVVYWKQVEVDGVMLKIQVPPGWQVEETGEGVLIAEHMSTMQSDPQAQGMQLHLFVHRLDKLPLDSSDETNLAWAALTYIVRDPAYIGSARVSEPYGFQWDGHDAAYYLLNSGDGNLSMLMAVVLPNPRRLIAFNVSAPIEQAGKIRQMLPDLLSTLTINGMALDITALHSLPEPLDFPR